MTRLHKFNQIIATVCVYAVTITLAGPVSARASDPEPGEWSNVLHLKRGDTVRVKVFGKRARNGKVEKAEESGITLSGRRGPQLFRKEDIQKVGHFENPKVDTLATWIALGGIGLSSTAEAVGSAQDLNQLGNGTLSTNTGIHNIGLVAAGLGIAVAGVVIYLIGGRPKTNLRGQERSQLKRTGSLCKTLLSHGTGNSKGDLRRHLIQNKLQTYSRPERSRLFFLLCLASILPILCLSTALEGAPITWYLGDVALTGGGSLTGSITYDGDANSLVSWSIASSAGAPEISCFSAGCTWTSSTDANTVFGIGVVADTPTFTSLPLGR
jgi:hypothetical protein